VTFSNGSIGTGTTGLGRLTKYNPAITSTAVAPNAGSEASLYKEITSRHAKQRVVKVKADNLLAEWAGHGTFWRNLLLCSNIGDAGHLEPANSALTERQIGPI
jgi:hypothetical protein